MAITHTKRVEPAAYNARTVEVDRTVLPTSNGTDFLRDELNLARKLDATTPEPTPTPTPTPVAPTPTPEAPETTPE